MHFDLDGASVERIQKVFDIEIDKMNAIETKLPLTPDIDSLNELLYNLRTDRL